MEPLELKIQDSLVQLLLRTPSNFTLLERLRVDTPLRGPRPASPLTFPPLDTVLLRAKGSLVELWSDVAPPTSPTVDSLANVHHLSVLYSTREVFEPIWGQLKTFGLMDSDSPRAVDRHEDEKKGDSLRRLRRVLNLIGRKGGLERVEVIEWVAQHFWR